MQPLNGRFGREWPMAGQHFIQDDAQGIEIAAAVDRFARNLLGAGVSGGADKALRGHRMRGQISIVAVLDLDDLGDAEVEHLDKFFPRFPTAEEHDVLGLQVPMHNTFFMCFGEYVAELDGDPNDLI